MASAASPDLPAQPKGYGSTGLSGLRKRFVEDSKQESPLELSLQATLEKFNPAFTIDPHAGVHTEVNPGPDIEWNPSLETYLLRVRRLAKLGESLPTAVPAGFPNSISSPRVWTGTEFEDGKGYIVILSPDELSEIEYALRYFKNLPGYTSPDQITRETFPLPKLGERLDNLSEGLHTGQGFYVLRGLDPTRYSAVDNVLIYVGITSYIGSIRGCQDSDGNKLIHIKDRASDLPNTALRQSPYANHAQPFHTDGCDLLTMYVLDTAAQGGTSKVSSSAKVYNEIAAARPDVIHTLSDSSWIFDKHEETVLWRIRPILLDFGPTHGPSFCYSRRPITGSPTSPRSPGVPPMTERQAEALDMVHFTAKEHALSIQLQRGDIQLVNNLAVFHARDAFVDDLTPGGHQRHILRLWLRDEQRAWPTPKPLQRSWYQTYSKDSERAARAKWSILPAASREHVLSRKNSCA